MVDRSVCVGDRHVLVVHPVKVEWLDVDDHGFFLAQHVTSLPHRCAASTTRAPGPRDATHRGLENETIHPMVSGTAREEAVAPDQGISRSLRRATSAFLHNEADPSAGRPPRSSYVAVRGIAAVILRA